MKSKLTFFQNVSKRSSVSGAHPSCHTYTDGVKWCGIGHKVLNSVPSYHMAHKTCCTWKSLDVFDRICPWLLFGHLSVYVGDSSRRSQEIVKNLKLCFCQKCQIAPFNAIIVIMIIIRYLEKKLAVFKVYNIL